MKFLVDENLPSEVAEQLREAGHEAATAFELGLVGQADVQLAAVCRRDHRALISLDLDFANTLVYPPADYFGLVVLRLEQQSKPHVLVVTAALMAKLSEEELVGKLWIVDEERIRIR